MSALTLYYSPGSSSMAPHIALHEIGVPFEGRALSIGRGDTRAPDYLAINPRGKVPTLLIDGRALTEVAAILYYLARSHPEARLLPEGGPEAEAQALSWMSYIASTLHPAFQPAVFPKGICDLPEGAARVQEIGRAACNRAFGLADRWLGERDWAVGGRYSVADIHLFRLYRRFLIAVQPQTASFPALALHYERMLARPAVRKTIEVEDRADRELRARVS